MRMFSAMVVGTLMILASFLVPIQELWAQDKKAPEKMTFKAKQGDVVFNHEEHVKAAKNDCKVCHDKLWPQKLGAPLNYKATLHKTAEAKHTSCGFCHHPGGGSFESKGNCQRCHHKGGGKKSGDD